VLLLLLVGLTAAEASACPRDAHEQHHAGAPGPGAPASAGGGLACGPECACACCPGHAGIATFVAAVVDLGAHGLVDRSAPDVPRVCCHDPAADVFRPPRA
jgi:hypothetical protein